MLTCIFHPIDPMRVVEEDEAMRLKASGVWFDCPKKAKNYRDKVEDEIKTESQVKNTVIKSRELKEQRHERK